MTLPNYFDHTFAQFPKFDKFFIGHDKFFAKVQEAVEHAANTAAAAYPPINIKKTDDNKYLLEMAVAGFGKNSIELTLEQNKLRIAGKAEASDETTEYLYKGISTRPFERTFMLNDDVVVNNAQYVNGLLKVWLEHIIPEEKKPKKIDIEDELPATPELLSKGKK
jgi:molecular chaperone IbpA